MLAQSQEEQGDEHDPHGAVHCEDRREPFRRHTAATPSTSIKKSGWKRLLTTIKVLAGSSP